MKQTGNFPKPSLSFVCTEDWNSMKSCEQGRFCGSCQEAVVDFTQKWGAEIEEMLAKREEKVCRRVYTHQLAPLVARRFSFGRVLSAAFMFLGLSFLSKEAEAQQKVQLKKQPSKNKTAFKDNNHFSQDKEVQESFITVTGIIGVSEPPPDLTGIECSGCGVPEVTDIESNPDIMPLYKHGG